MTDFNDGARYKMIQKLNERPNYCCEDDFSRIDPIRNSNPLATVALLGIGAIMGMALLTGLRACEREPMPAVIKHDCASCHNKTMAMIRYFKNKNVKSPEEMAEAVLKTRNPRLLAAIHVGGEKKTPHTAINTGWKGKYSGAWQTHERWGKITKHSTITEQALASELAIETHTAEQKDIIKGLNAYGGESDKKNGKYAFNVLRELQKVPK